MQPVFDVMEKVAQTDATVLIARRDRHRQGPGRARHPLRRAAQGPALRGPELRRAARHAARERALRPQARRVHRSARRQEGAVRDRRTAAPSSSTRSARPSPACRCGCCACSRTARSARSAPRTRGKVDVRIIAATNRDLRKAVAGRALPRGSLLPAARGGDRRCRRCASAARTSRPWRTTSSISPTQKMDRALEGFTQRGHGPAVRHVLERQRARARERDRARGGPGRRRGDGERRDALRAPASGATTHRCPRASRSPRKHDLNRAVDSLKRAHDRATPSGRPAARPARPSGSASRASRSRR